MHGVIRIITFDIPQTVSHLHHQKVQNRSNVAFDMRSVAFISTGLPISSRSTFFSSSLQHAFQASSNYRVRTNRVSRIINATQQTPAPTPAPSPAPSGVTNLLITLTNAFPVWVLLGATVALIHPPAFLWFKPRFIPPTLALIMLGMGLTTPLPSLQKLLTNPIPLFIGVMSQYTIMPLLSTLLSRMLNLPPSLAAGLILVGVCPGGAASNVVSLLAGGDVSLSVLLTLCSTLLSVLLIPFLMSVLASALVPVQPVALLMSTAQVVLLPLLIGALLQKLYPKGIRAVEKVLPLTSVLFVSLICAGVISGNASAFYSLPPKLVIAVCILHATGGFLGFCIARISGMGKRQCRTVSIEVMMQNSSLAVSLAAAHFANPLTALPGAISATVHSVFGSIMAGGWRLRDSNENNIVDANSSRDT